MNVRNHDQMRRGAAAVEFAMTAPILFTLVLGAIEFSRANMLVHTAAIAATEAARSSIVSGATADECRDAGMQELTCIGVSEATFDIDPPVIDDSTRQVTVSLTVPVNSKNGYILPRIFLGKQIVKTVTLQREGKSADANEEIVYEDGMQDEKASSSPPAPTEPPPAPPKKKKKGGDDDDDDDD